MNNVDLVVDTIDRGEAGWAVSISSRRGVQIMILEAGEAIDLGTRFVSRGLAPLGGQIAWCGQLADTLNKENAGEQLPRRSAERDKHRPALS